MHLVVPRCRSLPRCLQACSVWPDWQPAVHGRPDAGRRESAPSGVGQLDYFTGALVVGLLPVVAIVAPLRAWFRTPSSLSSCTTAAQRGVRPRLLRARGASEGDHPKYKMKSKKSKKHSNSQSTIMNPNSKL